MDRKTQQENRSNILYWVIAACLMTVFLLVLWVSYVAAAPKKQYDVVILGDSLMGLCRDETSVSALLEEELSRSVFNGAFGGTCMASNPEDLTDNYTMELLHMYSLSKAIVARDLGVQQTVRSRREVTDYFEETVDELAQVDFTGTDVLILAFGLNDYHAGLLTDRADAPYDASTYAGALRCVLSELTSCYPDLRIVLVTPTYSWYLSRRETCETYITNAEPLEAYVNKEIEVANEFGLEYVDLYHDLYTHEEWSDWKKYTVDGLHPNEESRKRIAHLLAQRIGRQE